MVSNLTEAYADYGKVVRLVAGVQLHGSSGARSSRLLMRGRRERMSRRLGTPPGNQTRQPMALQFLPVLPNSAGFGHS